MNSKRKNCCQCSEPVYDIDPHIYLQAQLQAQAQIQGQAQAQNDTDTISNVGNPVININTSSASIASYGNFWQTNFITVPFNRPFSFNQTGPSAGGVSLANPTTISVQQAGDYKISFVISINTVLNPVFPHIPIVSVFLNNSATPIPNTQTTFGLQIQDVESIGCFQLVGEAIIFIPANSTLQLKNNSVANNQSIVTCDNGINAIELSLQKLN